MEFLFVAFKVLNNVKNKQTVMCLSINNFLVTQNNPDLAGNRQELLLELYKKWFQ